MERVADLNILEQKVLINLDLIDIARVYCEAEADKSEAVMNLGTLMDIIDNNQRDILKTIDEFYL